MTSEIFSETLARIVSNLELFPSRICWGSSSLGVILVLIFYYTSYFCRSFQGSSEFDVGSRAEMRSQISYL